MTADTSAPGAVTVTLDRLSVHPGDDGESHREFWVYPASARVENLLAEISMHEHYLPTLVDPSRWGPNGWGPIRSAWRVDVKIADEPLSRLDLGIIFTRRNDLPEEDDRICRLLPATTTFADLAQQANTSNLDVMVWTMPERRPVALSEITDTPTYTAIEPTRLDSEDAAARAASLQILTTGVPADSDTGPEIDTLVVSLNRMSVDDSDDGESHRASWIWPASATVDHLLMAIANHALPAVVRPCGWRVDVKGADQRRADVKAVGQRFRRRTLGIIYTRDDLPEHEDHICRFLRGTTRLGELAQEAKTPSSLDVMVWYLPHDHQTARPVELREITGSPTYAAPTKLESQRAADAREFAAQRRAATAPSPTTTPAARTRRVRRLLNRWR